MSVRALLLGACAHGSTTITNLLRSDDTYWCLESLRRCGVPYELYYDQDSDQTRITFLPSGQGLFSGGSAITLPPPKDTTSAEAATEPLPLHLGASGITARLLLALSATTPGPAIRFTADPSLCARPLAPLLNSLHELSIDRDPGDTGSHGSNTATPELTSSYLADHLRSQQSLPLELPARTTYLRGGAVTLEDSPSSQFLSALMLAAPLMIRPTTISVTQRPYGTGYIAMTQSMMELFGAEISTTQHHKGYKIIVIPSGYRAPHQPITLEPDLSSGGYLLAYAALHRQIITLRDIPTNSHQGDMALTRVLELMGCKISRDLQQKTLTLSPPPMLRGGFTIDMSEMADQALTVAVLALVADGPITMTHLHRLRYHECDRIAAIIDNLKALGLPPTRSSSQQGTLTIVPPENPDTFSPPPVTLKGFEDHRVVMSFAVLASRYSTIKISGPQLVTKSFPGFFQCLELLGCTYT